MHMRTLTHLFNDAVFHRTLVKDEFRIILKFELNQSTFAAYFFFIK